MKYSHEVEQMCVVKKGPHHGPAPIPEEGRWVESKEIGDISGLSHGVGWCAPQQGTCKLTLNVKNGIVEEALVETIGCSGMTHSAAMAAEILPGKTLLECLNTDLGAGLRHPALLPEAQRPAPAAGLVRLGGGAHREPALLHPPRAEPLRGPGLPLPLGGLPQPAGGADPGGLHRGGRAAGGHELQRH